MRERVFACPLAREGSERNLRRARAQVRAGQTPRRSGAQKQHMTHMKMVINMFSVVIVVVYAQ